MTRSFALFAALLIMLAGSALTAHADVRSHTVKRSIDTLHVAMKPGRQLVLSFKAHVIELDPREGGKITAKLRRRTNTVVLWAPEDTPAERLSGRFAIATARYVLLVDVSAAGAEADDAIEIDDAGLVELCSARDLARRWDRRYRHAQGREFEGTRYARDQRGHANGGARR